MFVAGAGDLLRGLRVQRLLRSPLERRTDPWGARASMCGDGPGPSIDNTKDTKDTKDTENYNSIDGHLGARIESPRCPLLCFSHNCPRSCCRPLRALRVLRAFP